MATLENKSPEDKRIKCVGVNYGSGLLSRWARDEKLVVRVMIDCSSSARVRQRVVKDFTPGINFYAKSRGIGFFFLTLLFQAPAC